MKKLAFILGLVATASLFANEATIDTDKTYQTIDHFTAADAWSGNFVGQYFDESQKGQLAKWLFSQEIGKDGSPEGIGLSMWRFNIGGGTLEQDNADIVPYQRRAESFLTKDGSAYDWNKCKGQMYFMKKAKEYGCDKFLLFSNTPPVQWTKNGKGYCDKGTWCSNLKEDCYGKFAKYMTDVAEFMVSKGYNIKYISPINEPQVDWDSPRQEGSLWQNTEMAKLAKELDGAIENSSLKNTKILMGESASLTLPVENKNPLKWWKCPKEKKPIDQIKKFFDKNSPTYIGYLKHLERLWAAHSYHSEGSFKEIPKYRYDIKAEARKYGIEFLQTEWCLLPSYRKIDGMPKGYNCDNNADIYAALCMARIIDADLSLADSQGWGYWKGMEVKGDYALTGVYPVKDGKLESGGVVRANKILWALGNYSFFIRPEYKRIDLDYGEKDYSRLVGSAYISPDGKKVVAVFVNSSDKPISLKINFKGKGKFNTYKMYRTDPKCDLAFIGEGTAPTFAPISITTLVYSE